MIMLMYSLRDKLTDYGMPFTQPNDEVAKRTFVQLANGTGEYAQISDDIEIYKIGTFNTTLGTITPLNNEYIGLLRDFKRKENENA